MSDDFLQSNSQWDVSPEWADGPLIPPAVKRWALRGLVGLVVLVVLWVAIAAGVDAYREHQARAAAEAEAQARAEAAARRAAEAEAERRRLLQQREEIIQQIEVL
ncbi:hypothetical protein TspCOW1_21510 [Thiohalobacter sp. COW1]|uniref:hypothetical protein n=1 Tax=Thiohalobacter sp. COW1 TaxID=2795687 RepID=UPI001915F614|nr:hypothetical protein [Thiohalobacter sp. COW1]BCO32048.1 hypothetical protein TspCOW1_21510 [Thiohalobacter sp. COW1]